MTDPTKGLLRWLGAHDPVPRLLLTCPEMPVPRVERGTVAVRAHRCLGECDIGLPAQLLVSGVGQVLTLPCAAAEQRVTAWQQRLHGVQTFHAPRRGRRPAETLVLGQIPLPRRALLGLSTRGTLDLSHDDASRTLTAVRMLQDQGRATVSSSSSAGARPEAAPRAAAGTAGATSVAAGPADSTVERAAAAVLTVDGCTACGVCVRACPHDALTLEHDGDTSTLTHLTEDCRSEHQCVALCPVDAFTVTGHHSLASVLEEPVRVLATVETSPCERCGARHPSTDGPLCPACRFREANAFGSALPPGVADKLTALRRQATGPRPEDGERD